VFCHKDADNKDDTLDSPLYIEIYRQLKKIMTDLGLFPGNMTS